MISNLLASYHSQVALVPNPFGVSINIIPDHLVRLSADSPPAAISLSELTKILSGNSLKKRIRQVILKPTSSA